MALVIYFICENKNKFQEKLSNPLDRIFDEKLWINIDCNITNYLYAMKGKKVYKLLKEGAGKVIRRKNRRECVAVSSLL